MEKEYMSEAISARTARSASAQFISCRTLRSTAVSKSSGQIVGKDMGKVGSDA
jgi:hypothetical protein